VGKRFPLVLFEALEEVFERSAQCARDLISSASRNAVDAGLVAVGPVAGEADQLAELRWVRPRTIRRSRMRMPIDRLAAVVELALPMSRFLCGLPPAGTVPATSSPFCYDGVGWRYPRRVHRNDPASRRFVSCMDPEPLYPVAGTHIAREHGWYLPAPETRRYWRTSPCARRPLSIARHRCSQGTLHKGRGIKQLCRQGNLGARIEALHAGAAERVVAPKTRVVNALSRAQWSTNPFRALPPPGSEPDVSRIRVGLFLITVSRRPEPNTQVLNFVPWKPLDLLFVSIVTFAEISFDIESIVDVTWPARSARPAC
jgi:hypothetical protein